MGKKGYAAALAFLLALALIVPAQGAVAWGDRGETVKSIQRRLIQYGYLNGSADGVFGKSTYDAVIWFQKKNGLKADGVVGPATLAALAEHPNIAAVKEANGDISKIVETFALAGDKLDVYSGNDDQITPILAMGGQGVISVLSNAVPRKAREICERFFAGDVAGSAKLQCELLPLVRALFSEVNPIPVKAAMAAMGWCENYVRLPLVPMEEAHWQTLRARLVDQGAL